MTPTLEEIELQAATIQKCLEEYESFLAHLQAGGDIGDPHDTYPDDLYEAAVRPVAMKLILAGIAQLRPLQERVKYLEDTMVVFNPVALSAGKLLKKKR